MVEPLLLCTANQTNSSLVTGILFYATYWISDERRLRDFAAGDAATLLHTEWIVRVTSLYSFVVSLSLYVSFSERCVHPLEHISNRCRSWSCAKKCFTQLVVYLKNMLFHAHSFVYSFDFFLHRPTLIGSIQSWIMCSYQLITFHMEMKVKNSWIKSVTLSGWTQPWMNAMITCIALNLLEKEARSLKNSNKHHGLHVEHVFSSFISTLWFMFCALVRPIKLHQFCYCFFFFSFPFFDWFPL